MKRIICLIPAILVCTSGFNQQIKPTQQLTKQDYLEKTRNRKTTAWIFFGTGTALVTTGIVLDKGRYQGLRWGVFGDPIYKNDDLKITLVIIGTLSMLSSIPFFMSAGINKKKAMKIGLNIRPENSTAFRQNRFEFISYPVLSCRIRF